MKEVSELKVILNEILKWNNARISCFCQMLLALFAVRTVNLRELAVAFCSQSLIDSRYKRIKRFFAQFDIDFELIARFVFRLFFSCSDKLYLTIDRTNWFWGQSKINVLTLAIAYEGMAIPILWTLLNKAGNATAKEHHMILERFVKLFGKGCIAGVLGDREFASGELFEALNKQSIPFYIRIKEGSMVRIKGKKLYPAERVFNKLAAKQHMTYPMSIEIFGQSVNLAGSRSDKGELMIVATNQPAKNAIPIYLRRWEIETLFSCLKGRGFRFEETRLVQLDRIEKLMALLTIAVAWAHKVGEWRASIKPIRFNNYRDSKRPQYSYFRYGLDLIRDNIFNPSIPNQIQITGFRD